MGMRRVAVVGAGMTKFMRRAVVQGTAPDAFDGIHMNSEYLSDGCGAWKKPYLRCYVGGGTGVYAIAQGWFHVASGLFDTALVVCEEKMSSCLPHPQAAFLTIFDNFTEQPLKPNLLWIFALEQNRYMARHGITNEEIARVAVKNKKNAMGHPSAQLGAELTVEEVLSSEIMAWPVHRLMVSPTSDGASAVVLAAEDVAKRITNKPVWVQGVGWCLDSAYWTNRDLYYPEYVEKAAWMAYEMAGVREPRKEIDIAEPYDPFAYKELHHLEGLQLAPKGKAPQLLADGVFDKDGDLPVTWQLRGEAGKRQVPGKPERGVAQAWGDLMQVGTVVVMGTK
jgi:acetyl-CoA C-acetyltransferase